MNISRMLKKKKTFSFEVFPPKEQAGITPLFDTLSRLYGFEPDFVSCTYGAGGTNKGKSEEICAGINISGKAVPLAHFTCVGNTREDIESNIREYVYLGVSNFLALRGDFPAGWTGTRGDFSHASELIGFVRGICPELCIGAACYPETHIDAVSPKRDLEYTVEKQQAGAEYFISQLCFDPVAFSRFLDSARASGLSAPVIAGIMPVVSRPGLLRMTSGNGCSVPERLARIIEKYEYDPDGFKAAGEEYTVGLIEDFESLGVDGIHIYTLNRYDDIAAILNRKAGLK